MHWDLGLRGVGLLIAMSIGFGLIAQLVAGTATTRWLWLVAAVTFFGAGLFISEGWFGWATEEELQPNIDGLSVDEVLLGVIPAAVSVLITRLVTRRRTSRRSTGPTRRTLAGRR